MSRAHISDRTKLASVLLVLGQIDYEHAKAMGRENFLSLWQFDHGILHAIEVNDEFWNLTPRLISPHREKSRKDTSIVAKVKRISRANDAAVNRLLKRQGGEPAPRSRWPSRKIQSRVKRSGSRNSPMVLP